MNAPTCTPVFVDLFIPLKSEYYDAFAAGEKDTEYRAYGPRWNERTCPVGRGVVLSRGYGKKNRMRGIIVQFSKMHAAECKLPLRASVMHLYGTLDIQLACIQIEIAR